MSFESFFSEQSFVPGAFDRPKQQQQQQEQEQNGKFQEASGLFPETLPYASQDLQAMRGAAAPPSIYNVKNLTDEWFSSPQLQSEKCGCGNPKKLPS